MTDTASTPAPLAAVGSKLTILAIVLIVLGLLCLLAPFITGIAIAYLVGAIVLIAGIVRLIHAFQSGTTGARIMDALIGVIMVIGGVLLLTHPVLNLLSLTLLLAIYFVVTGVFTLVGGFRMAGHPGWGFVVFNGIVTILLGAIIWWGWPITGTWAIGVLVGIHLLLTGMQLLAVKSAARSILAP